MLYILLVMKPVHLSVRFWDGTHTHTKQIQTHVRTHRKLSYPESCMVLRVPGVLQLARERYY